MSNPNYKRKTNRPYKQRKPNARAMMFSQFFLDPTSKTFWNVRGSAIRAGFSEEYANNITVQEPKWWLDLKESAEFNRGEMLRLSEQNMSRVLKDKPQDIQKEKLQIDTSKFISERLGKEYYSTRKEVTGADGKRLFEKQTKDNDEMDLSALFVGVQAVGTPKKAKHKE